MSVAEAENWAANLTVDGMEQKLRTMDVWVAEIDGRAVGWGAVGGEKLEGLYTDPDFACQGVGSGLLSRLEAQMRARAIRNLQAEASLNAEAFYLRRGYVPAGSRRADVQPYHQAAGLNEPASPVFLDFPAPAARVRPNSEEKFAWPRPPRSR
jgi:hypothetical protein